MLLVVSGLMWLCEDGSFPPYGCRPVSPQCLVQVVPPGKRLAGLMELPGGKVEEGECLKQALRREWREELGLEIEVGDFIGETVVNLPDLQFPTYHRSILVVLFQVYPLSDKKPEPRIGQTITQLELSKMRAGAGCVPSMVALAKQVRV